MLLLIGSALAGDFEFSNPSGSRYTLHTPAALPQGGRSVIVSQKMLATTLSLGVTDHVEVALKASPVLLGNGLRTGVLQDHVMGGVRVKSPLGEALHVGLGVESSLSYQTSPAASDKDWAGYAYGLVTWGDADRSLTLGAGVSYKNDTPFASPWGPMGSLAGQFRLTDRFALASEQIVGSWAGSPSFATSAALRTMGPRWTVDVGAAWSNHPFDNLGQLPPLPWLELSWRFGQPVTARADAPGTSPP